jgi:hypothetical protein
MLRNHRHLVLEAVGSAPAPLEVVVEEVEVAEQVVAVVVEQQQEVEVEEAVVALRPGDSLLELSYLQSL